MPKRLPIVVVFMAIAIGVCSTSGQPPTDNAKASVSHLKVRQVFIPFKTDSEKPIKEVRLFAQRNGGAWTYLTSAAPTQLGFNFFTDRDGRYSLTVQTVYRDDSSEPAVDKLRPGITIVIDTVPPKIELRSISTANGERGVEWDIVDDHLDPTGVRLECRCSAAFDWTPLDTDSKFKAHDQRVWMLQPNQTFEIRLKAVDLARNETISREIVVAEMARR